MKHLNVQNGFTFIELVVVIGILSTIVGLAVMNLGGLQRRADLQTSISSLISEIKQQQIKAMIGDTEGTGTQSTYGIYFQSDSYTTFRGSNYSAGATGNFTVNLGNTIEFSTINLPASQIIFDKGSGEIANFVAGTNTITIRNTTNNEQRTITINKYGVITQVN